MQYARLIGSGIEMETLSYIIFCHFIKDIICNMWSSSALYRVIPDQYDSFDEYNKVHVKDVTDTLTMKRLSIFFYKLDHFTTLFAEHFDSCRQRLNIVGAECV